jgi:hypothetical protein
MWRVKNIENFDPFRWQLHAIVVLHLQNAMLIQNTILWYLKALMYDLLQIGDGWAGVSRICIPRQMVTPNHLLTLELAATIVTVVAMIYAKSLSTYVTVKKWHFCLKLLTHSIWIGDRYSHIDILNLAYPVWALALIGMNYSHTYNRQTPCCNWEIFAWAMTKLLFQSRICFACRESIFHYLPSPWEA